MTNPYAFVPLGDGPRRSDPRGHAKLEGDGYSGSFLVDISVLSPLLLGGFPELPNVAPRRAGGQNESDSIVPGSTLAGSVRAVHEALTGSCLRVVDVDYVPVHRAPLKVGEAASKLALVEEAVDGIPTKVRVLGSVVAIGADALQHGWSPGVDPGGPVYPPSSARAQGCLVPVGAAGVWRTGDRLSVTYRGNGQRLLSDRDRRGVTIQRSGESWHAVVRRGGQTVWSREISVTADPDGDWVLVISDTKTRKDTGIRWRLAHIPADSEPEVVADDVRERFARALEDADDLHALADVTAAHVNVYRPQDAENPDLRALHSTTPVPVLGQRLRLHERTYASRGTPVWIQRDEEGGPVTELRVSQVWRRPGDGHMDERIGGHAPCREKKLCPSCRLFGSAGHDDRPEARAAEQNSYAGHVRFADAVWERERSGEASQPVLMPAFTRAPLASPKPTAGQFYLMSGEFENEVGRRQPLAHWGSEADDGERRPIAGRKFYWATTSATTVRGRKTDDDAANLCAEVRPIQPGAVFTTRVTFDNLDRRQLAELFISIDPSLLWPEARSRLGGGRPFGWGSVRMTIDEVSLTAAGPQRYTSVAVGSGISVREVVADYRAAGNEPVQWSALRAILTPDSVPDQDIAYPSLNGDPFAFWQSGSGWTYDRVERSLKSPPMAHMEGGE